ncbi:polysaccharide biosynthesis protein, partial [Porphyromonas gingivalis]
EYQDTSTLILLSVAAIPISCSSVVGLSIASQAKMWTGLLFNMLWAVIFIGLSMLFFANGLGGVGMSLAILISYSIHAIAQLFYLNKVVAR